MKALTITYSKSVELKTGEWIKFGGEWDTEGESAVKCLIQARNELEEAFKMLYKRPDDEKTATQAHIATPRPEKPEKLTQSHQQFNAVKQALKSGRITIEKLPEFYDFDEKTKQLLIK